MASPQYFSFDNMLTITFFVHFMPLGLGMLDSFNAFAIFVGYLPQNKACRSILQFWLVPCLSQVRICHLAYIRKIGNMPRTHCLHDISCAFPTLCFLIMIAILPEPVMTLRLGWICFSYPYYRYFPSQKNTVTPLDFNARMVWRTSMVFLESLDIDSVRYQSIKAISLFEACAADAIIIVNARVCPFWILVYKFLEIPLLHGKAIQLLILFRWNSSICHDSLSLPYLRAAFWFWFCCYLSNCLSHSLASSQPITGPYFLEIALRMDLIFSSVMWPSSIRFFNIKTNNLYFVSDCACFWLISYLLTMVSIYHSKRLESQVIRKR